MFVKRDTMEKMTAVGCCGWFGFSFGKKSNKIRGLGDSTSHEFLLDEETEDEDVGLSNRGVADNGNGEDCDFQSPTKRAEENLRYWMQQGFICREFPVKETHSVLRSEDENGIKTVNEYVYERKIGGGSYGKVVLYRSNIDGKSYAIKSFHKSYLLKIQVTPSETAMSDVLREVLIMKVSSHPNIVNLIEVIDDPTSDHFYMVLEYVDGKWVFDGSGPACCLGENTARKYLRDVVSGLMYLHAHLPMVLSSNKHRSYVMLHILGRKGFPSSASLVGILNIVHGDIKPDNLLITGSGAIKIGDFGVSQVFEDDNDELRRSPGTPVFTAPECCIGETYYGKAADTWAVGVTLYCMVLGKYPFLGENLQDTYDKIVNDPLLLPDEMSPLLKSLLEGLLCRDPMQRMTLEDVAQNAWVVAEDGPILPYLCWCKRHDLQKKITEKKCSAEQKRVYNVKIRLLNRGFPLLERSFSW